MCIPSVALPAWAQRRAYLPTGMPLCKRVGAVAGWQVHRAGNELQVCSTPTACTGSYLRATDSQGRPLEPAFPEGVSRIQAGMLYLHSAHPRGLDSRYLGLFPSRGVALKLAPLLVFGTEK